MSADLALAEPLVAAPAYSAIEHALQIEKRRVAAIGLTGPARAAVMTLLLNRTRQKVVLVVPDDAALAMWHRDLVALASLMGRDPRGIVVFPALACDPYSNIPPHPEVERDRVRALGRLRRQDLDLLLVAAGALLSWLPPPAEIAASSHTVRVGAVLAPERFLLDCLRAGYRRVDTVAAPGEISRRGGIVDIYPPEADEPVRIELFGDTVESLRSFDPDHQRSTGTVAEAVIGPAAENPATDAGNRKSRDTSIELAPAGTSM
jgi:transcription-repair coupling factor (superfamily II helicase)